MHISYFTMESITHVFLYLKKFFFLFLIQIIEAVAHVVLNAMYVFTCNLILQQRKCNYKLTCFIYI